MQNIRRAFKIITLAAIYAITFPLFAQKNKNIETLIEVAQNSGENIRHKSDKEYWISIGFNEGKEKGYSEGYQKGRESGFDEGYEKGINNGLIKMDSAWLYYAIPLVITGKNRDFEQMKELYVKNGGKKTDHNDLAILATNYWTQFGKEARDAKSQINLYKQSIRKNLEKELYDKTQSPFREIHDTIYNKGWRNGFQTAYNIHLKKGQNVTLKEVDLPSNLDYIQLVKDIHTIQGKSIYQDATTFSNLIKKLHVDMIDYLSLRLDLSEVERRDALLEYDSIHQFIAKQYYEKYLSIYRSWGIEAEGKSDFYNYHFYHTTHSLIDVISSGLCSVADVCLTYSKANSQYSAIIGLETGNVCWVLREDYLQTIYYNLLKVAFSNDLDKVAPQMQSSIRQSLTNFVAESQTHKKVITEMVELSEGERAEITMEITSVYNVGFELDDISVDINHQKQNINIEVARTPRLLGIVQQQCRILKVVTEKEYTYTKEIERTSIGLKPILRGEEKLYDADKKEIQKIARVEVNEKVFNQILEKYKPSVEEIKRDMQKLPLDAYKNIMVLVQKLVEPAISLPNTNYKADFRYSKRTVQTVE